MSEPWAKTGDDVIREFGSNPEAGISPEEAKARLEKSGGNRLVKERRATFWSVLREEITEPMILLLLVVAAVYSIWGTMEDIITILAIVILLVFAEIFTEFRAKNAIAALKRLSPATTPVIRGGSYLAIPADEIVKGDVIPLEAGDRVPADGRIITSLGLQVDESPLTGESTPVSKEDTTVTSETSVADRHNMVFAGTTVTSGLGKAVITATGMETELGKITGLVLEAREPRTPLQLAMRQLSGILVWVAVFFSIVIPLVGYFQGKDWKEMILTGLSLSFATIPEELPIIITMVLGVGAFALSRKNVLIRRLRAAETLGEVSVIVTDKTGTITENKMTLSRLGTDTVRNFPHLNLNTSEIEILKAGALTSHVKKTPDSKYAGDPLEVALLEAVKLTGTPAEEIQKEYPILKEFSFDNQRKMMSAVVKEGNDSYVYAKGAPEAILRVSSQIVRDGMSRPKTAEDEAAITKMAEGMAAEAMRVIAFARKQIPSEAATQDEAEKNLTFLGIAGMIDPPRKEVPEALRATSDAGIRVIMVSGDHALTVRKIAEAVGIDNNRKMLTGQELSGLSNAELEDKVKDTSLFARINPEQKLRIVKALQETGEVVAVTGDGINDAPALKSADIGIAMGESGTEAAREASSMVLTDDSYSSIVHGVREGRKIFDNLKKGVTYYLSVKVALVLCFAVPLALNIPLPFAPIQIVLLELFMDLAASATFVAEPMEPDAMKRPPRPRSQKFLDRFALSHMGFASVLLASAVLIVYLFSWYTWGDLALARTLAFGSWLTGHIFLAFSMRSIREPLWQIGFLRNRLMLVWSAAVIVFFLTVTNIPFAVRAIKVTYLYWDDWRVWTFVLGVPFVMIFWLEIKKIFAHQ